MFKKYAKFYDLAHKNKNYRKEAASIYKWAEFPKHILDLGCGTGQHAKHWAKKISVGAVDKSEEMLKVAHRDRNIKYLCANLKDFVFFSNCAVSLFNVVGYCHLKHILKNSFQRKGAIFIFDCWIPNKTIPKISVRKIKKDWRIVNPVKLTKNKLTLKIRIFKNLSNPIVETHVINLYSLKEIKKLAQKYNYKIDDHKHGKGWQWYFKLKKI